MSSAVFFRALLASSCCNAFCDSVKQFDKYFGCGFSRRLCHVVFFACCHKFVSDVLSMSIVCAISNAIAKSVNHMCHIVVRNVGRCWSRQIVSQTLSMQCVSSKLAKDNVNDCAFHFFLELCGGHVFRCCEHLCQRCVGVHMVKEVLSQCVLQRSVVTYYVEYRNRCR